MNPSNGRDFSQIQGSNASIKNFWSAALEHSQDLSAEAIQRRIDESGLELDPAPVPSYTARANDFADNALHAHSERVRPRGLFVDNDPSVFELVPEVFDEWDRTFVQSSKSAINAAGQLDFQVALIDIGLVRDDDQSNRSGTELLRSLRSSNRNIPVLMITGLPISDDLAAYFFRLGSLDYMKKPIEAKRVAAWLELLARRHRSNLIATQFEMHIAD